MSENVNFRDLIKDIARWRIEPDKKPRWRYEDIGQQIGLSRSSIGRIVEDPIRYEPKYSKGVALIKLHKQLTNEGSTNA